MLHFYARNPKKKKKAPPPTHCGALPAAVNSKLPKLQNSEHPPGTVAPLGLKTRCGLFWFGLRNPLHEGYPLLFSEEQVLESKALTVT